MSEAAFKTTWRAITWVAAAVSCVPILYMVMLSMMPETAIVSADSLTDTLRQGMTFSNFPEAFLRADFARRLRISTTMTGMVVAAVFLLGMPAAYGIARLPPAKAWDASLSFLSVRIIPGIAASMTIFAVFHRTQVFPAWASLGLLFVAFNLPIFIWLSVPVLRSVSQGLLDLLLLDGGSFFRGVVMFLTPMVYARLLGVLLVVGLLVWNEAFFSSVFRVDTVTECLPSLITHRGVRWGQLMALGTMVTLPLLVVACGLMLLAKEGRNDHWRGGQKVY